MQTLILIIGSIALITGAGSVAYLSFVSAKYNGWKDLAATYRLRGPFAKRRIRFQSAAINEYSFPGNWVLGVSEEGLFLKLLLLSHLFHPPLVIPWRQLTATSFAHRFAEGIKLTIPEERFELELSAETRDRLLALVDPEWSLAKQTLSPPEPE